MDENKTTLSLRAAYSFGVEKGLEKEITAIRDMVIEWDSSYTSSLRRGFIIELFEQNNIYEDFKNEYWLYGNTTSGESKKRRYLRIKKQYEDFLSGRGPEMEGQTEEEIEEQENDQQFAAEADLRDFLAKNPSCIEKGLRLYQSSEGRSGIEFPVENGFIDILAIDQNQTFVVVELKVGRGRNKTIGQLLYYMGWVDKNLAKAPCRGMIIAKEIPSDLALAVQRVPGVSLYRYNLSVSVELLTGKP
ncbi:MAG TPA: endonuclease NucS [Syntrophorhabdus sp.]|nr:endonuclease NucS [Syntrophorhabdus sp.]